jgi:hypothetical protein
LGPQFFITSTEPRHVQILVDDAFLVVLEVLEHHGAAAVLEQLGRSG